MHKARRSLVIEGPLTIVSPLHISMPGDARFDPRTNRMRMGGDTIGLPCTLTRSISVLSGGQDQEGRNVMRIPVIPANGWRGRLRRAAANVIEDHILGNDGRLNFETYQSMHSGAINGSPDGVPVRLNEATSIRNHCFLGLFGGGSRMVPSNYKVSNGYPILSHLLDTGVVPQSAGDSAMTVSMNEVWRTLFDYVPLARVDDIMQMRDQDLDSKLDKAELQQKMLEELGKRAEKKARKGVEGQGEPEDRGPLSLQFLSYSEVVTTGTRFWQKFTLDATEAQIGLFLLALNRVIRVPMGGKSTIGNGEYACKLNARLDGENIGEVISSANGLDFENERIKGFVAAAEKEIGDMNPENLALLFKPADKPSGKD